MRKREAHRRAPQRRRVKVVNVQFDAFDVYIGRSESAGPFADTYGGLFGNPYKAGRPAPTHYRGFPLPHAGMFVESRERAVEWHREYLRVRFEKDAAFRNALRELRGLQLGCWCKGPGGDPDIPCHGDAIKSLVDADLDVSQSL